MPGEQTTHVRGDLNLLTLFAKGDKANLTKAERNDLAGLVDILVDIWKGQAKS